MININLFTDLDPAVVVSDLVAHLSGKNQFALETVTLTSEDIKQFFEQHQEMFEGKDFEAIEKGAMSIFDGSIGTYMGSHFRRSVNDSVSMFKAARNIDYVSPSLIAEIRSDNGTDEVSDETIVANAGYVMDPLYTLEKLFKDGEVSYGSVMCSAAATDPLPWNTQGENLLVGRGAIDPFFKGFDFKTRNNTLYANHLSRPAKTMRELDYQTVYLHLFFMVMSRSLGTKGYSTHSLMVDDELYNELSTVTPLFTCEITMSDELESVDSVTEQMFKINVEQWVAPVIPQIDAEGNPVEPVDEAGDDPDAANDALSDAH